MRWLRSQESSSRKQGTAASAYGDLADSGQIRLLKLHDVQPDSDLRGTLRVVNLSDLPKYYAISYTWGSPEDSKQIFINAIAYPIRKNLWECLHAIMHNFQYLRGSWVWADALCIRQDSIDEKNHQVSQIHTIFARAQRVYAWFGSDPQAEHTLRTFPTQFNSLRSNPAAVYDYNSDKQLWRPVASAPYFKRTWIIQECALANALVFVCGTASWTVNTTDQLPVVCSEWILYRLLEIRKWARTPGLLGRPGLLTLIRDFRTSLCDEPRDMVYALQSLAAPSTQCAVDYGIEKGDLFWRVLLVDTGLLVHITCLQEALKVSWDNITNSVERLDLSISQRPSLQLYPSSFVSNLRCAVPGDGSKTDNRLVVFQQEDYRAAYSGTKGFYLLYGSMRNDDICIIVKYEFDLLILTRPSDEDALQFVPYGIALMADAEKSEGILKVLEKIWQSGIDLCCRSASNEQLRLDVYVSPLVMDALHKMRNHLAG